MTDSKKSFGADADDFLEEFYRSEMAETTGAKIAAIERRMDLPPSNYYVRGGTINDEMKLGCLEYEFLEQSQMIELVLC